MRETIKRVVRRLLRSPARRVADYWATDHKIDRPRSWLDHPVILRHVHERVTGDASVNGVLWFQRKYLPGPVDIALSLGCGLGPFERDAIRMKIAERLFAVDISPGAIGTARRAALPECRTEFPMGSLISTRTLYREQLMTWFLAFRASTTFLDSTTLSNKFTSPSNRAAAVPDAATCDGDHQSGIGDFAAVLPQESVH
jgi:hypothetical protein